MLKEYKYKNNVFMQAVLSLWIVFLVYLYISSLILFVKNGDIFNILLYTVFMAGFLFFFWYMFKLYFLKRPILEVSEDGLKYHALLGVKDIQFEFIEKIELKVTAKLIFLLIMSEHIPPISVRLNRVDDNPDDVYKFINKYYHAKKAISK